MTVNAASPAGARDPGVVPAGGPAQILLVSGSTRAGSTNTAALRTLRVLAAPPVAAVLYDEMADLPAFNPDDDHDPLPPAVARMRRRCAVPGRGRRGPARRSGSRQRRLAAERGAFGNVYRSRNK